MPRVQAEPRDPIGGRGARLRLPEGNGSILERQLCSRGQSAGLFIGAVLCPSGAGVAAAAATPDHVVGPHRSWAGSGLGTRPDCTLSREEGVGKLRSGTGAC